MNGTGRILDNQAFVITIDIPASVSIATPVGRFDMDEWGLPGPSNYNASNNATLWTELPELLGPMASESSNSYALALDQLLLVTDESNPARGKTDTGQNTPALSRLEDFFSDENTRQPAEQDSDIGFSGPSASHHGVSTGAWNSYVPDANVTSAVTPEAPAPDSITFAVPPAPILSAIATSTSNRNLHDAMATGTDSWAGTILESVGVGAGASSGDSVIQTILQSYLVDPTGGAGERESASGGYDLGEYDNVDIANDDDLYAHGGPGHDLLIAHGSDTSRVWLYGGEDDTTFVNGHGNITMIGGEENNHFIIDTARYSEPSPGFGYLRIMNFRSGDERDVVDMRGFGIDSFEELQEAADFRPGINGQDIILEFGDGLRLEIHSKYDAAFTEDNFIFGESVELPDEVPDYDDPEPFSNALGNSGPRVLPPPEPPQFSNTGQEDDDASPEPDQDSEVDPHHVAWNMPTGHNTSVRGDDGDDDIVSNSSFDRLLGGDGDDRLVSSGTMGQLEGESGDDLLAGRADFNLMLGGDGNDTLLTGTGHDLMFGATSFGPESGNDVFIIDPTTLGGVDHIYNFDSGVGAGDIVDLRGTGIADFAELMSIATLEKEVVPGFVVADNTNPLALTFSLADDHHIRIYTYDDTPFAEDDFIFGPGTGHLPEIPIETVIASVPDDDTPQPVPEPDSPPEHIDLTKTGTGADDTLYYGGTGNVLFVSGDGDDLIIAGGGHDTAQAGDGDDIVKGYHGHDDLNGGDGNDALYAGSHNDVLSGDDGDDYLNAWNGDDLLDGGNGNDVLLGGDGSDVFHFDSDDGTDYILDFGSGDSLDLVDFGLADLVTFQTHVLSVGTHLVLTFDDAMIVMANTSLTDLDAGAVILSGTTDPAMPDRGPLADVVGNQNTVNIWEPDPDDPENPNDAENSAGLTSTGDNHIRLNIGDDTWYGGEGDDIMLGDDGDDTLSGESGIDVLNGGSGNDRLDGGADTDLLTGGAGDDTFVFTSGTSHDIVTDFEAGAGGGDRLDVSDFSFAGMNDLLGSTTEIGDNVSIHLDSNDSVTLIGVRVSDLHEDDFLF